ncbi:MAG: nuclease [Desulfobacteraceae bacterium]|nr:MAG: nuclease [Desulfobacteraceae bacterium]
MLNKTLSYILLFLIIPLIAFAGEFKVTRVYDGDTFKATDHNIEIKVRLVGIDAPETKKGKRESGQPFSQQSKKFLTDMVLNKTVEIKGYGTDQYNRQLAVVFVDGKNVNLELLKAGLAEVYRGKHPRGLEIEPYEKAQIEAKNAMKGIWSLCKAMQISPKDWRKSNKHKE